MSFRISIVIVMFVVAQLASATPTLRAVGSMSAGAFPSTPEAPPPFNLDKTYQKAAHVNDPALFVAETAYYPSLNSMHYHGKAQFGRLATVANASGPSNFLDYDIFYQSSLSVSFQDVLRVPGLVSGFLGIDFELDGILEGVGAGADFGAYYDNGNEAFACQAQINPGHTAYVSPTCASGQPDDVTLTHIGLGDWKLYTHRTFFIPMDADGTQLFVAVRARATCDTGFCSADLGNTALIGNVKVYDSSMQLLSGLSVISESGYDYLTPPSAPALSGVPEPGTYATLGVGLLLLGTFKARSTTSKAAQRKSELEKYDSM
jgi:hypothetical protein